MSKTRDDLINAAAEELKILGAGQVLSTEDRDKIDEMIEPTMAELATREIVAGIYLEEIPDEFFGALAEIVARSAAAPFGLTGQELTDAVNNAADAERRILAMTLPRATGQRAQPEYM